MTEKKNYLKNIIAKNCDEAFCKLLAEETRFKKKEIVKGHCEVQFRRYQFDNERIAMQYIENDNYGRFNIASIIDLGELQLPKGMHKFIFYGKFE